jgi:predicted metal-dependent RNase
LYADSPTLLESRRADLGDLKMTDAPTLSVTMLGAGQEVGRSCCVLQYRGKTIVCDTGVHPAYSGMASLPFVDELDWSTVDAILITQCAFPDILRQFLCVLISLLSAFI